MSTRLCIHFDPDTLPAHARESQQACQQYFCADPNVRGAMVAWDKEERAAGYAFLTAATVAPDAVYSGVIAYHVSKFNM
jgi:hypothetical protein